jgi:hypothetical protein
MALPDVDQMLEDNRVEEMKRTLDWRDSLARFIAEELLEPEGRLTVTGHLDDIARDMAEDLMRDGWIKPHPNQQNRSQ